MEDAVMPFMVRSAAIGATVLGGIVAGFSLNRMLVELPVWNSLGAEDWARFARAELGRGLIVYPLEGITALLLSVGAAICCHLDASVRRTAALPLHIAAIAAILAFVVTRLLIAPHALGLRDNSAATGILWSTLAQTKRWWKWKTGLHLLTFIANIWGLVELFGS